HGLGFSVVTVLVSEPVPESMVSGDAEPLRGGIVKFHIGWKGERNTLYKGVDTFPYQTRFENRELRRAVWSKWQSGQYLLAGFLGCYTP
ncbi:hypothetical protein PanWU01x14_013080, partial [Parasponia andersonii]